MLIGSSHARESEMFVLSGLARLSNSKNLTRFKIAAGLNTLMTFAGEYFTAEIERESRYNVVQIEISFVSTGRNSVNILLLCGCCSM